MLEELRDHVAKVIGPIAKPDEIIFTPDLPKTRSGKIMRRLLRDVARGNTLGDVTTLANAEIVEQIREQSTTTRRGVTCRATLTAGGGRVRGRGARRCTSRTASAGRAAARRPRLPRARSGPGGDRERATTARSPTSARTPRSRFCVDAYSRGLGQRARAGDRRGRGVPHRGGPEFERDRALLYEKYPAVRACRARSRRAARVIIEFRVEQGLELRPLSSVTLALPSAP